MFKAFSFLAASVLKQGGVIAIIGLIIFLFVSKYSQKIFDWIEEQTYGLRDFIMEKLELLFIEIPPHKITYILLFITFGMGCIVCGIFALNGLFLPGIIGGFIVAFIGWKIPKPLMNYLVERRIKAYQNQMVDGLNLLANGVRAGLSLPQSVAMVVDELSAPISQEFNLILQQNKIGVPLDECFENLMKRVPTQDNQMFVSSISILRETGGNLAEVFDTIIIVIRERIRLQQKIDTYVAQGKMQGGTIFAMPYLLAAYFTASDPETMKPLVTTPIGWVVILVALAFNLTGGFFILKIVKIKV